MSEREKILARVREALTVPAPRPGHHHAGGHPPADPQPDKGARRWLPAAGDTFAEWLTLFRAKGAELKAEFHLVDNAQELESRLRELSQAEGWKQVASHKGRLTTPACDALKLPVCLTDAPYDVNLLETCDAGITECDALVAQTGSVLITSRSAGGRAVSVLPPHHVVIARREQLLPDLPAAFDLLKQKYAPDYPSFISFITGPSRTGDIERILVLGAHGPKKLTIFCI
jgi:L-lactate dehydrogenase complex protein LldG